jgi:hypothetical protein
VEIALGVVLRLDSLQELEQQAPGQAPPTWEEGTIACPA